MGTPCTRWLFAASACNAHAAVLKCSAVTIRHGTGLNPIITFPFERGLLLKQLLLFPSRAPTTVTFPFERVLLLKLLLPPTPGSRQFLPSPPTPPIPTQPANVYQRKPLPASQGDALRTPSWHVNCLLRLRAGSHDTPEPLRGARARAPRAGAGW